MNELMLKWINHYIRFPVIGLDISDLTVKFLKFGRGKKVAIDSFGEVEIPAGMIEGGEIKKEKEFSEFLKEGLAREKSRFRSRFVSVSLPEEKSFVRVIQLPKIKRDEVQNAIRWEIEANIPLPPEKLIYDHEIIEPLEGSPEHFDVVITAFPADVVYSYVRAIKSAGFEPAVLELESQAIARAVICDKRSPAAKIVMDIGRTRTSLILYAGAIIFTKTLEVGGAIFEENIGRALGVDEKKALEIKTVEGFNKKVYEGKVFEALAPAVSALSDEVGRIMNYYRSYSTHRHGASREVEKMILCGGDANLLGLDTYLSASLKIPVARADPFAGVRDRLKFSPPAIPKNQALGFTTVVGLALRGL